MFQTVILVRALPSWPIFHLPPCTYYQLLQTRFFCWSLLLGGVEGSNCITDGIYITAFWNNPDPGGWRSTFIPLLFHGRTLSPRCSRSCSPPSFFWWPAEAQHTTPMLGPSSHVYVAHIGALFTAALNICPWPASGCPGTWARCRPKNISSLCGS